MYLYRKLETFGFLSRVNKAGKIHVYMRRAMPVKLNSLYHDPKPNPNPNPVA